MRNRQQESKPMSLLAGWWPRFLADRRGCRRVLGGAMLAVAGALWGGQAALSAGAGQVNIYSYRQEFLIRPFLDQFTKRTGITVNVVYAKAGTLERLKAEGENTSADMILTVDIGRLQAHKDEGLLQPIDSAIVANNVPAQYRDPEGEWVGLTTRARVVYYARDRVKPGELGTYEDLAERKWKGRICVRSGSHRYNVALVASMIARHGEAKTEEWVKGLVANFARKPQGNDRAQVKAILEGVCDVAIGNTYYMGRMATNRKHPEQKRWAAASGIFFPNQGGRGTHVNISGAAVVKYAKNKDNAVKLIEFLSDALAQEMYAKANFEYPVKDGVAWHPMVESWGRFKPDTVSLAKIARLSPTALKVIHRAGWL